MTFSGFSGVSQHIPNLNIFPGQVSQSVKHAVKRLEAHLFTSVVIHGVNRTHRQPRALRQGVARNFTLVKNRLQVPVDHTYRVSLNHKTQYSLCLVYILTPYYNGAMSKIIPHGEILESAVPTPRLVSGVYFLLSGGVVVYVGQSRSCHFRIGTHVREGEKQFDAFSIFPLEHDQLDAFELANILHYKPAFNTSLPLNSDLISYAAAKRLYKFNKWQLNKLIQGGQVKPFDLGVRTYFNPKELDIFLEKIQ